MVDLAKRTERATSPLARWPEDVWNWFDNFFSMPFLGRSMGMGLVPALDLEETEDQIILSCELPGVEPKDVDVSIRGDVLTIRGEKRQGMESPQAKEGETREAHRVERRWGTFVREVTLPAGVDASMIEAKYHNGVLNISLPKSERARPKRIEVKAE